MTTDLDGVLVIAHSDKEGAAPTWKRTYGHHHLPGFVDHGLGGTGEPVAALLGPGNAGLEHRRRLTAIRLALAQPPKKYRRGRQTLIRTDSVGAAPTTSSPGFPARTLALLLRRHGDHRRDPPARTEGPRMAWTPVVEADGEIREGAWVAELTSDVLDGWPKGMRLIARKERPHPGGQLG
ncbi:transposase [Streptomyces sp. NPDC057424]|uniref:transposase n=1 Tax=Streptomyces sp. NPDC057424 TaxID=3346127 RepID=UPI0036CFEA52